jgi:hypothetical protein
MASIEKPTRSSFDEALENLVPKKANPEALLAEFDDLLRNRATSGAIFDGNSDALDWVGRAAAAITHWDSYNTILTIARRDLMSGVGDRVAGGHISLLALLSEARHSIRMMMVGPTSVAIEQGAVFDYFEGVRKIVAAATVELLVVDPYLDAEFVSTYFPLIPSGVAVRLLAVEKKEVATLVPAVDAWAKQHGTKIEVRVAAKMHDRYVFVDGKECYQSGASFKDGAKHAPTTLTQIVDAFDAMQKTYETKWGAAKVIR